MGYNDDDSLAPVMSEYDLNKIKSWLFIAGGVFAAVVGAYFSKTGFGFELPGFDWIGWGLAALCIVVQIAFSSQLAYRSFNWVIFVCGLGAYIYSGWSNHNGILQINPSVNDLFAWFMSEFIDWIAEPLIVLGLIGVSPNGQGDFIRNFFRVFRSNTNRDSGGKGKSGISTKSDNNHSGKSTNNSRPSTRSSNERNNPTNTYRNPAGLGAKAKSTVSTRPYVDKGRSNDYSGYADRPYQFAGQGDDDETEYEYQ